MLPGSYFGAVVNIYKLCGSQPSIMGGGRRGSLIQTFERPWKQNWGLAEIEVLPQDWNISSHPSFQPTLEISDLLSPHNYRSQFFKRNLLVYLMCACVCAHATICAYMGVYCTYIVHMHVCIMHTHIWDAEHTQGCSNNEELKIGLA